MKRKIILFSLGIVLILTFGGYYAVTTNVFNPISEDEKQQMTEEAKEVIEKDFDVTTTDDELIKYESYDEGAILQVVHNMTHQKVDADKKWGAAKITKDRVEKLYSIVTESKFKNKQVLLDILDPWRNEDFTNAVEAHNKIWNIQGGNVGKAKRLLTPLEELEYIEKHF